MPDNMDKGMYESLGQAYTIKVQTLPLPSFSLARPAFNL
jgi:hypothetical protein